jgi:hypothetical protein
MPAKSLGSRQVNKLLFLQKSLDIFIIIFPFFLLKIYFIYLTITISLVGTGSMSSLISVCAANHTLRGAKILRTPGVPIGLIQNTCNFAILASFFKRTGIANKIGVSIMMTCHKSNKIVW